MDHAANYLPLHATREAFSASPNSTKGVPSLSALECKHNPASSLELRRAHCKRVPDRAKLSCSEAERYEGGNHNSHGGSSTVPLAVDSRHAATFKDGTEGGTSGSEFTSLSTASKAGDDDFVEIERRACAVLDEVFGQTTPDGAVLSSTELATRSLKAYQKACEDRAMYRRADFIQQVVRRLRLDAESNYVEELTKAQMRDRAALEESYSNEFREFHRGWNARIAEFDKQVMEQEIKLVESQNDKLVKFREEIRDTSPRILRYSRGLIESRMRQQSLARQEKYVCAQAEKRKADAIDALDLKRFEEAKVAYFARHVQALQHHQDQELRALRKRIESRRIFLEHTRQQELEILLRRYMNARSEMENQQGVLRSKIGLILQKHSCNTRGDDTANASLLKSAG